MDDWLHESVARPGLIRGLFGRLIRVGSHAGCAHESRQRRDEDVTQQMQLYENAIASTPEPGPGWGLTGRPGSAYLVPQSGTGTKKQWTAGSKWIWNGTNVRAARDSTDGGNGRGGTG